MTITNAFDRAATLTLEGRFAQALAVLDQSHAAAPSGPWTVLRGELLERVGKFAQSEQLINAFLRGGRRSAGEQSASEFTLGRIRLDEGETGPALAHLQRAVALASKDGNLRQKMLGEPLATHIGCRSVWARRCRPEEFCQRFAKTSFNSVTPGS